MHPPHGQLTRLLVQRRILLLIFVCIPARRRFALVAEEGVVTHLAVDQGSIDLDETSAEAILSVLRPGAKPGAASVADEDGNSGAIAAVGVAAAAAAAYYYSVAGAGLAGLSL